MRKMRIIIIVILILFLFSGVAFARWSDMVEVDTIAGSGDLKIQIMKAKVISSPDNVSFANKNIKIKNNKTKAVVKINDLYPGASVVYDIYI